MKLKKQELLDELISLAFDSLHCCGCGCCCYGEEAHIEPCKLLDKLIETKTWVPSESELSDLQDDYRWKDYKGIKDPPSKSNKTSNSTLGSLFDKACREMFMEALEETPLLTDILKGKK